MRTVALIQARLGSTRLPCKAMLPLHGLPVIDWVVRRVRKAALLDEVVVATSHRPENDVLEHHLARQGVAVFRGPEDDVLERFRLAGAAHGAEQVVRICADNPLVWGPSIDELIRFWRAGHAAGTCDYAYNHIPRGNSHPDGLGAETLSFALLTDIAARATLPAHREHCLSYIWDNPGRYRIRTFDPANPVLRRPDLKLDMDTPEEYRSLALLDIHPDIPPEQIVALFPSGFRKTPGNP